MDEQGLKAVGAFLFVLLIGAICLSVLITILLS